MPTDAYKRLTTAGQQLAAAAAAVYTAPTGGSPAASGVVIRHMVVVNNDTVDRTFALYRGGTTTAHLITPPLMLVKANGGFCEWDGVMALSPGEAINGVASVASLLNVNIDGDETTQ